jgi:outer membrane protein TolC
LYQQQANVASARAQVTSASRTVELAKVDVIQTLQLDAAGNYEFVAPAVDTAIVNRNLSLDSLIARAYAHRSDLDAQESRLDAAGQDVKAAGASKLPTVSLNANYNTAYTSANDLPISSQLDQRRGGGIGIGVSLPSSTAAPRASRSNVRRSPRTTRGWR